ncbi:hypothetical protein ACFXJ8_16380 [Nonomuraea sp. NPDC059194]|uniref:hypothetical protein n=1 Tax=Nonomuraea sp. NPDC059194 TaxID=3346764 RepID=UPI00367DC5E2
MNRLLGVTAAAAIVLAGAAPAVADPTVWKWGPVHSTDGHAQARGAVAVGQSGFVVYGKLADTRGSGCSWVQIRAMSSENGRWRSARFANCVPGTAGFRKSIGGVLQIKLRVCRGSDTRATGRCSRWKTIYTQGG